MKESYKEDLASNFGFELYADNGNVMVVATTDVYARHPLTSEVILSECRHCPASNLSIKTTCKNW